MSLEEQRGGVSDYDKYATIQKAMRLLIAEGEQESVFFDELWKQSEMLKNKTSGMPPSKPAQQEETK